MDDRRFDNLARIVARDGWSRRAALRLLGGGALAALRAPLPTRLGQAATAAACAAHAKPCKTDGGCCSGFCLRQGKCAKKGKLTGKCRCRCPQGTTECGTKLCCGTGQACQAGACAGACVKACAGKTCGDDGCEGSCGTCEAGQKCRAGQCVPDCVPDCAGKVCGGDGCGGFCGTCGRGHECQDGTCVISRFGCRGGDNYCSTSVVRCPNSTSIRCSCITDVEGTPWCAYTDESLYCSTCTTNADCPAGWACYDARDCHCPNSGGIYQGRACAPTAVAAERC